MAIDLSLPRSSNEIVKVWPSRDPRLQVAHIISVLYLLTHQQENPQEGKLKPTSQSGPVASHKATPVCSWNVCLTLFSLMQGNLSVKHRS